MDATGAGWRDRKIFLALVLVLVIAGRILAPHEAAARDLDGRYANSPLTGSKACAQARAHVAPTPMGRRWLTSIGNRKTVIIASESKADGGTFRMTP